MAGVKYQLLAISGLGGCGKTATAIEYAWRTRSDYTGGIFWLSGESDEMLSKSVDALIELLGDAIGKQEEQDKGVEDTQKEKKDVKGPGQKLNRVLSWLHKRSLPWLVVVDDTDHTELSPSMYELLRGSWMRESVGHVLVTSRCKPEELREMLQLHPTNILSLHSLIDQESVEFLKKRISVSLCGKELQDAFSLSNELGGLPLALEQAAVYINVVKCTVKEYLEEFKDQRLRLLRERKTNPTTEYYSPERLAIHTTWQVNIEHISKAGDGSGLGEAAVLMMRIAAFLSPDIIPIEVVNIGNPEVDDRNFCHFARRTFGQRQIVDLLTKFSLFEQNQELNSLSVHRLVQEVIRERCAQDGTRDFVLSCAVKALHKAFCDTFTGSDLVCWWDSFEEFLAKKTMREPVLLPSPSTGGLWIKLAINSNCLKKYLAKYVSSANAKTLWLTKENARLLRETALYFSHFRNFSESRNCHKAVLRIIGALNKTPSPDEIDKLTRNVCLMSPCTDNFSCQYGTWNTSLKPRNRLSVEEKERFRAAEKKHKTEVVTATEQAVTIAFGKGNYIQCCTLIDQVVSSSLSITVDTVTSCKENICPDHAKLYNYRCASLMKLGNFEESFNDVTKWLECCPGLLTAHYRKVYILCKLAENNPQRWRARARAAMAVLLYKFGENSKAIELRNKFPQFLINITYVEVSNTRAWLLLDKEYNEMVKENQETETVYIFTGGDYEIEKIVRSRGNFSFVGLPGQIVRITVSCGILLSSVDGQDLVTDCMYMLENLHFIVRRGGIICCGCVFEATGCFFEQAKNCGQIDDFVSSAVQHVAVTVGGLEESMKDSIESIIHKLDRSLLTCFEMKHLQVSHSHFNGLSGSISRNQCSGVRTETRTLRHGNVVLEGNIITNFGLFGITIPQCNVAVTVRGNVILACGGGIKCRRTGTTTVSGNHIMLHNFVGILCHHINDFQVSKNKITHGWGHGMVISRSDGKVQNNQILSSACWGLVVTSGSNLQIEHNNFSWNGCGGVRVFFNDPGHVTVQENEFQNAGPPVYPVDKPHLLEQQVVKECSSENEEAKTFLMYGKNFALSSLEIDVTKTTSFNPPKLINNVQNPSYCARAVQDMAMPDLCSNCSSRMGENTYTCKTCWLSRYCGKQCCLSHVYHQHVCKSLLSCHTVKLNCKLEAHTSVYNEAIVLQLRKRKFPQVREGSFHKSVAIRGFPKALQFIQQPTAVQIMRLDVFVEMFGHLTPSMMLDVKEAYAYARFEDNFNTCRLFLLEPAPAHLCKGP